MKNDLRITIEEILKNPEEPPEVLCAALESAASADFSLSPKILVNLTGSRHESVRQLAWQIIRDPELVPLVRKELLNRLDQLERELVNQSESRTMKAMNRERALVIRDLAIPENLGSILKRRFTLGIEHEVEEILDGLLSNYRREIQQSNNPVLARLLSQQTNSNQISPSTIIEWCRLIENADLSISLAAAHLLSKVARKIPASECKRLLKATLSGHRLSALATLVGNSGKTELSGDVALLLRSSMRTIRGPEQAEAWGKLCQTLKKLDDRVGDRAWVVGLYVFYHDDERKYAVRPGYFPLASLEFEFSCDREDYQALFVAGGDEARAAAYQLSFYGLGSLLKADSFFGVRLGEATDRKLTELAEAEHDASWQGRFACAAAYARSLNLLPWLVRVAGSNKSLRSRTNDIYDQEFARTNSEALLAVVFRAIGALSRFLVDDNRPDEAAVGITFLREQYRSISPGIDPSLIAGLTTGLCYLGKWKPVLTHLRKEYYYVHTAAENVFDLWIPRGTQATQERERAAKWIARQRNQPGLAPIVRDTLNRIHDKLCKELGRFIDDSDDIDEVDDTDGID